MSSTILSIFNYKKPIIYFNYLKNYINHIWKDIVLNNKPVLHNRECSNDSIPCINSTGMDPVIERIFFFFFFEISASASG